MQKTIIITTNSREGLYDITSQVAECVVESGVKSGFVNVYAQGATAAIMIQENWDKSVQEDVVDLLRKLIPQGIWKHGPSETIPIVEGRLGLSTWQNIFFCEFDGPRNSRNVLVTVSKA
jgi:thiamine phosphate synthase YjbQ (UPF0047 family)